MKNKVKALKDLFKTKGYKITFKRMKHESKS